MALELKVTRPVYAAITFNHEEIKKEIADKVAYYKGLVYTEDQINEAKADRANLNRFVKALDDERKKVKKETLAPYEEFERKLKEITDLVNEPIGEIDKQLKEYEAARQAEKTELINGLIANAGFPDYVKPAMVWSDKWLNKSVSLTAISTEIAEKAEVINKEAEVISNLPEYAFEAMEVYKTSLNLPLALSEGQRLADIQKRKVEAENAAKAKENNKVEEVTEKEIKMVTEQISEVEQETKWIDLSVYVTKDQCRALSLWLKSQGIPFKAIKKEQ